MHILLTADTIGGVWTYTQELVCGLVRRGVRVTLVSFGEIPEPRQLVWMDGLRNLDYRPTAFRLEWMQDSAEDLAASTEYLSGVIRETRPDVLQFSQYCYGALDVDIPKVIVAHSDVLSWWEAVHGEMPPESDWIHRYRDGVRQGLSGADAVLAPSRWMLSQIARFYGEPREARVIYNGRAPQRFNPHGEKDAMVLTVGRLWDAAKQTSLLTGCNCGWPVVIAGSTEHPDQAYRNDCATPLCSGRVEFLGKQTPEQLRGLFARASIYAATSRYEPFGLAPLEAALSRCVLVANDTTSFREVWGETAVYFKTNDPSSLRDTLETLQRSRGLRSRYAQLAYLRARQRFTADRMVEEYLDFYDAVIPARASVA